MSSNYRIDPRVRALGKARIDVIQRAKDEEEFQRLWHPSRYPLPFSWGEGWQQSLLYFVDDYAAEIGFFIDVLGLPVNSLSASFAQFTGPDHEFFFSVAAAAQGEPSTPPDTLRLQFLLANLPEAVRELEKRGVGIESRAEEPGETIPFASFRTPHGVLVELIGEKQESEEDELPDDPIDEDEQEAPTSAESFWAADEWDEDDEELEDEAESEEPEPAIPSPPPLAKKDHPAPVIEVTYEDIAEKDGDEVEDFFEHNESALPVPNSASPARNTPASDRRSTPRPGAAPSNYRQLDIPMEASTLVRSRNAQPDRSQHDGAVIFPLHKDRRHPREDN